MNKVSNSKEIIRQYHYEIANTSTIDSLLFNQREIDKAFV